MTAIYQANVSLWLNCNLKCPYCFGNPSPPPREWPEEISERLHQLEAFLRQTGRWKLILSGGETTIYPGFADLCERLSAAGHEVVFFTNGIVPLAEVFSGLRIKVVSRVDMSYQLASEKVAKYDQIFDDNIAFLQKHGVEVAVNYVLYPNRKNDPAQVRARFDREGVKFRYLTFQGEFEKRQYPFAHSVEEKDAFANVGDLRALFLMEHGYYMPTFKKCRAGSETFYISFRTGGVYACEQLQQRELANFIDANAAKTFAAKVSPTPLACPAKRCTCRLTIDQEKFLETHDVWDMTNYSEWQQLSLPTDEALNYWKRFEKTFADELSGRLNGNVVYLWGGGVHTLMLLRLLQEQGFPMPAIKGIIDSNDLKHGQEILGFPIVSREHFDTHGAACCSDILISSRAFEEDICRDICTLYGDRFNVIRLYDGSMNNRYEALENSSDF